MTDQPRFTNGTEIFKVFAHPETGQPETYRGEVMGYEQVDDGCFYLIQYDDGDQEHLMEHQVAELLDAPYSIVVVSSASEEQSMEQVEENNSGGLSRRRSAARVNYLESSSDEDDTFSDGSDKQYARKQPARKQAKTVKAKKKRGDSDESVASFESEDESEVSFDSEQEDEEEFVERSKPTKRSGKQPATKKQKTTGKKKMADSFNAKNKPTYPKLSLEEIQTTKDYLDPGGMEATDNIIDGLVGEQVDKIAGLLDRAMKSGTIGALGKPLQLGTACSGTDAPALALTLVQEQLELRGKKKLFHHSHIFSCENEPFKQAYLARNFDSILYPDITRLVNLDEEDYVPCDVYGQEKKIPPFNMFVAGTSCKNFSMQNSKFRIDIEDKGCSGETFLAATEVLFKEKPELAIFENVDKAPWAKMSEYITGRVKLADCSSSKAIKEIKDKNKELQFVLDKSNDQIVVDDVPSVYGVRCGAVVAGFMKPGSAKIKAVKWPSSSAKKKQCSLSELIRANKIDKANDTLVFETECTYCTQTVKVDTKEFGLPQTRCRVYMFVWRPENDDVNDNLGQYWVDIVKHLKSPVRHSLDAFMLQDDHEVIRLFREALNGPPGRQSKRACFLEQDFWSSVSANLPHNKNTRATLGMEDTARWLMNWGPSGKKQIPPSFWLEYFDCNSQRTLDMVDVLYGSALRDAESHDPLFCSHYWNVSQNVSKEPHRAMKPGIAGCVTPGGDFLIPHRGRPLLGCEKLLIQGLPYFRLILGIETEVQLGDLAGNAMSLTVVCATLLAALTCKQLREEDKSTPHSCEHILRSASEQHMRAEYESGVDKVNDVSTAGASPAVDLFRQLASLAEAAAKSSILCTCETSGRDSLTEEFLCCKLCGVSCCRNCINPVSGYNLSSHDTREVKIKSEDHDSANFQTKLRNVVPPSLTMSDGGWINMEGLDKDCHRVEAISGCSFNLHRIKRERKKWVIVYYARENHGIGEAVAELRLQVGELYLDGESSGVFGMCAELTSYMPSRTEPRIYGRIAPCAKLIIRARDTGLPEEWAGRNKTAKATVRVEGTGTSDSPRVEVGLKDSVATDIRNAVVKEKAFKEAKSRGEARRWLYADNWKQWPSKISLCVQSGTSALVNLSGEYVRASCRQTTNQSALWIKKGARNERPLYILIQPNVNRTGSSKAVVSCSVNHDDLSSVIAEFPPVWEPCDAFTPKDEVFTFNRWTSLPDMKCKIPKSTVTVSCGKDDDTLVAVDGLSKEQIRMFCRGSFPIELTKLNAENGQQAQQVVRVFNSTCVAPILQLAASSGVRYDLGKNAKWVKVPPSSVAFGHCKRIIPFRPSEEWEFNDARETWERRSNPQEARKYCIQLQEAPKPFELWLDPFQKRLLVKYFPEVVAHQAANNLIHGRGSDVENSDVSVHFRLSDVLQQSDPVIAPFTVGNCNKEKPASLLLKEPFRLYDRQQKVVTKMLAIEKGGKSLEELEMSEYQMPGSSGISLVAKATRTANIRGGVIADAIGSGKTLVSIALILAGLDEARASRVRPQKSGATLVVVPPGLISQWESEIQKFTDGLTVVKICSLSSYQEEFVLKDIINADVVIIPIDILESSGYLNNLLELSKVENSTKDVPKLPPYSGQLEQNAARGVWIPHTSTDPYGGGKNKYNQQRRDQSAFYTHRYSHAIDGLRRQTFKDDQKGVPVEFFEFERLIVDEVHETLCTSKGEMQSAKKKKSGSGFFTEKNRRAGRELLGITQRDTSLRPLVCRRAVFGLTGTPLLDSSSRVIELASLMGGCYVIGLSSHWRKLERESARDIFLHNYLEPKQSREVRKAIHAKAQEFLDTACCRNKCGEEMAGIQLNSQSRIVQMNENEKEAYLKSQSGIPGSNKSLAIRPDDFDASAGHDISRFLRQNAKLECRGKELVRICKEILETDSTTKIVVFTDGRIDGGIAARDVLQTSGLGCTWLDVEDSVERKNEKLGWYRHGDGTEEDRLRPRVLVLHFEHAAGLNLQSQCYNLILFTPLYVGDGGSSSDPVVDCSTEQQAIGRVFRPGQPRPQVNVYRIEVRGPDNEECLDGHLIRRNTDEMTIEKAVNAGDD